MTVFMEKEVQDVIYERLNGWKYFEAANLRVSGMCWRCTIKLSGVSIDLRFDMGTKVYTVTAQSGRKSVSLTKSGRFRKSIASLVRKKKIKEPGVLDHADALCTLIMNTLDRKCSIAALLHAAPWRFGRDGITVER